MALTLTKTLPEATNEEIESKAMFLFQIIDTKESPSEAQEILQLFENLHTRSSFEEIGLFKKHHLASEITRSYNEMNLVDKSNELFKKYLSDCLSMNEKTFTKINQLTSYLNNDNFTLVKENLLLQKLKNYFLKFPPLN